MIEVVCAVIVDGAGRLLACRRADGRHLAGKWEFPGGKVEPGEDPRRALEREIAEELGITVATGEALAPVEFSYGDLAIRLSPFICEIMEGTPVLLDHSEIRWCAGEREWAALDWAEADLPILAELPARITI